MSRKAAVSKPTLALPARAELTVPALIAGAGDRAAVRFLEFFTRQHP
jgi:hypothetical protein